PAREDHPRRPASAYGASKLCGEEYLALYQRAFGASALALRYANVYGPGQDPFGEAGVVAIFLEKMLSGADPGINRDGEQTRDHGHVSDVARINAPAGESPATRAPNVGAARATPVNRVAEKLGVKRPSRHGPAKPGEQRRSVIDPSAAGKGFGWRPEISLEDGLAATAEWFRSRRRQ